MEEIKTILYQLKSEYDAERKRLGDPIMKRFVEGKLVGLQIAIEKIEKLLAKMQ